MSRFDRTRGPFVAALAVVLCTGAAIRGCTEEPVPTEMTGQCQGEKPRKLPDEIEAGVVPIMLAGVPERGASLEFEWSNPEPDTFMLDDFIVQCWTKRGWRSAWIQLSAFGIDDEPSIPVQHWRTDPSVILPEETHAEAAGTLLIPAAAPTGLYRFQMIRSAGNVDWTVGEVRFELP